jgi:hypothetical protein
VISSRPFMVRPWLTPHASVRVNQGRNRTFLMSQNRTFLKSRNMNAFGEGEYVKREVSRLNAWLADQFSDANEVATHGS